MSGPKGAVISVEEQRRRDEERKEALRVELREALNVAARMEAEARAHRDAGVVYEFGPSVRIGDFHAMDAPQLEAAVARVQVRQRELERTTGSALSAHNAEMALIAVRAGIQAGNSAKLSRQEILGEAAAAPSTDRLEEFQGLLSAALRTVSCDDEVEREKLNSHAQHLLKSVAEGADPVAMLYDFEHRVHRTNAAAAEREKVRAEAAELLLALTGIAGEEAAELRRRLTAVQEAGTGLRPDDRVAVEAAVARRQRYEDRVHAAAAFRETLEEMGYSVGEEFDTELLTTGAALADRAGWTEHALQIRLPANKDRVVLSAVRTGGGAGSSAAQTARDIEVEEEFCAGIGQMVQAMEKRSVRIGSISGHEAGTTTMLRVEHKSRSTERRTGRVDREREQNL